MSGRVPIAEAVTTAIVAGGTAAVSAIEGIPLINLTGPAAVTLMALLVITDKLVWHTRLKDERADRQHWQAIALKSLGVAEKIVDSAEVTNDVLQAIPLIPDSPQTPGSGGLL